MNRRVAEGARRFWRKRFAVDAESKLSTTGTSSGSALPGTLRRQFEGTLGADLGGVRIHTSAESAAAAKSVSARAYTVGQDIHFAAGQYDPSSHDGQHLLAHEVAHTVQQAGGVGRHAQFKLDVSTPGDAHEIEADRAADAMVAGRPVSVPVGGVASALNRQQAPGTSTGASASAALPPVAGGVAPVSVAVGIRMTAEAGLRDLYAQGAQQITARALQYISDNGNTPEAVAAAAEWAANARNALKASIRAEGSPIVEALAKARNLRKYGDEVGPSYDDLIRAGKTPEDIVGSAGRVSEGVSRASQSPDPPEARRQVGAVARLDVTAAAHRGAPRCPPYTSTRRTSSSTSGSGSGRSCLRSSLK